MQALLTGAPPTRMIDLRADAIASELAVGSGQTTAAIAGA